jgi:hypothetical protein
MIQNKMFGTRPVLAHAPGKLDFVPLWKDMMDLCRLSSLTTSITENLTVITFNNGFSHNEKPVGLLEGQLNKMNIDHIVLGSDVVNWKNSMKLSLLKDELNFTSTEYVLIADSSDVFVVNRMDAICDVFVSLSCEALFNSEKKSWPLYSNCWVG